MDINIGSPNLEVVVYKKNEGESPRDKVSTESGHLSQFKDFVCAHQGEIAQVIFLSLEHHKRFREAFQDGDLALARSHLLSLLRVSTQHLKRSWKTCVEFADRYFERTQTSFQSVPRICLKGTKPGSRGTIITDIYRGSSAERTDTEYLVSENTAFDMVSKTGRSYRCNDIPAEVVSGGYSNPRLNLVKATSFASANPILKFFRNKREDSRSWGECWVDYTERSPTSRFYRSTLVVPLTLVNNDGIDEEFDEFTILGVSRTAARATYAFLCFDHPAVNYFTDEAIDVGYIMADLLSFHFMTQHTLLKDSVTVRKFQEATGFTFSSHF